MATKKNSKSTPLGTHLVAGGTAGLMEALVCHPLDTIKVRMQLSKSGRGGKGVKARGFIATGAMIVKKESPLGLYKGLGAVVTGIVPKMAIRFAAFERYKAWLTPETGKASSPAIFLAGLGAGVSEAVAVVGPMEVVKIRLQAQHHSMTDPMDIPKYRNAGHALFVILREEGLKTLYRGVGLTALRQATNQAANFTAYTELKRLLNSYQPQYASTELPSWQTMIIGLISGACGPFTNAPIDTIKTRIQRATALPGETAWSRITTVAGQMFREEGFAAFYKGITPRVARVAPGQAVVFAVYEKMRKWIEVLKSEVAEVQESS